MALFNPVSDVRAFATYVAAFRGGLGETGYVEGRNVVIEFRWAEGQTERLAPIAAELVRHPVSVLVAAGGSLSAVTAKRATSTIPIVFLGVDANSSITTLSRPASRNRACRPAFSFIQFSSSAR